MKNTEENYNTYFQDKLNLIPHDPEDPLPIMALYLDQSTAIDPESKAALLYGLNSKCRQYFLPLARPFSRAAIIAIQLLKIPFPKLFRSPKILHHLIYLGLKYFASRDANLLIMRHFHCGSEILQFVKDNIEGVDIPMNPLKPYQVADVKENLFLIHDLNLFNFIIRLNKEINEKNIEIKTPAKINFDAITDGPFHLEHFSNKWHNFLDTETAIELYTPIFQLFLSDNDFWRAANSLQLDETIAVYVTKIIGDQSQMWRVNNKHPMVPMSTLKAGFRLLLHGYSSESIHYMLRMLKRQSMASQ